MGVGLEFENLDYVQGLLTLARKGGEIENIGTPPAAVFDAQIVYHGTSSNPCPMNDTS